MSKSLGNSSTRGRPSTARAPTPCAGGCSRTAPPGSRAGSATRSSTRTSASSCCRCGTSTRSSSRTRTRAGSIPMPRHRPTRRSTRWIGGSRPSSRARSATARERLDAYDATGAGRRIQRVPRRPLELVRPPDRGGGSGTRAARAAPTRDAAFATLHRCLVTLAQLLAPFTPFVAEALWRNLAAGARRTRPTRSTSRTTPRSHEAALDPGLDDAMATARAVVELGRRVRVETKTQHPPAARRGGRARRAAPGRARGAAADRRRRAQRARRSASPTDATRSARGGRSPTSRCSGPRLGARVQALAAALAADDGTARRTPRRRRAASTSRSTTAPRSRSSPTTSSSPRTTLEGWGVASDGGVTVALELDAHARAAARGARARARPRRPGRAQGRGARGERPDRARRSRPTARSPRRVGRTRGAHRGRDARRRAGVADALEAPRAPHDRSTGRPSRSS